MHSYSKFYSEWLFSTYGTKTDDDLIESKRAEYTPGWSKYLYDGWYNLALDDNEKIVTTIIHNIRNAGIPFLDRLSNWQGLVDYYLENPGYYMAPAMIDFCLIENNFNKAKQVKEWFWEFTNSNADRFDPDHLEELRSDLILRDKKITP